MDSITHIAIGACIGEVFLGRALGRRALAWGALAQSIPDIDVVASLWKGAAENLLTHRGFTHSLLFAALVVPLFAWAADRLHRPHDIPFRRFCWFFGVAVFGHTLLDGLNAYGTGWFEPFDHVRVSLNVLFVADPLFSVGTCVAALVLLFVRRERAAHTWALFGLLWCVGYVGYATFHRMRMVSDVERLLGEQHVAHTRTFITPTVLNNWLWYVVAESVDGYHIGYRSVFDTQDTLELRYVPRRAELLAHVEDRAELDYLIRFSQGFYTVEQLPDGATLFNDLRFGQVMGWRDPQAPFAFRFYLHDEARNALVIQRGRFDGWDRSAVGSLLARIRGR